MSEAHKQATIPHHARRRIGRMSILGLATSFFLLAAPSPSVLAQGAAYQIYQYDSLGNLIRSWGSDGTNAVFSYDSADNRTSVTVTIGPPPPAPPAPPVPPRDAAFDIIGTPGRIIVIPRVQ